MILVRQSNFSQKGVIQAAFTTREGGESAEPYQSLNLGLSTDDDPGRVRENRRRAAERIGFEAACMAFAGQVHGNRVQCVSKGRLFAGSDGLATDQENILLCITAADCAAVLLVDEQHGIIGACHVGWRGCVGGVLEKTVDQMCSLGAEPSQVQSSIGPCISVESFEVGEEVAAQFSDQHVVRRDSWPRPHVDLCGAIEDRLIVSGLTPTQIERSDRCTFLENEVFFSHRAEHGVTGRMLGMIGMRT